jgi:hypothetical protein
MRYANGVLLQRSRGLATPETNFMERIAPGAFKLQRSRSLVIPEIDRLLEQPPQLVIASTELGPDDPGDHAFCVLRPRQS